MSLVPKRGQFKPSSAPPRTAQTMRAKSDSVSNLPGEEGTSNNERNRTAIRAPALPRIFSPAEGVIASADRILPEAREMTKIEAKKYATVMPAEVTSVSQLDAALPNHGVDEHSAAMTRMENTGVPEARDSERKARGIILAPPMVDSTRDEPVQPGQHARGDRHHHQDPGHGAQQVRECLCRWPGAVTVVHGPRGHRDRRHQ